MNTSGIQLTQISPLPSPYIHHHIIQFPLFQSGMSAPYFPFYPRSSSPDGIQPSWRSLFRTRRRVTFWLVGASFALIVLYSHWEQPLGGEKILESCQSLDPQIPCAPDMHVDSPPPTVTITQTAPPTTKTMIVEPPVQPVVFALIMYSESSAKEGAVFLKVLHLAFCYFTLPRVTSHNLFFSPLSCTLHDPSIFTSSATKRRGHTWRGDYTSSHTRYIASPCDFTSCHYRV
jgi:hypothetical protein